MPEGERVCAPFFIASTFDYDAGMRLFAAIETPDFVKDELTDWWYEVRVHLPESDWRAVAPHLWHLTLAFYGDVAGDDADDLAEHLHECADEFAPMRLKSQGFGVFPRAARPRVFWAGIETVENGRSLKQLAHCCRRAGHATVRKRTAKESPFRGHVTMARAKGYPGPLIMEIMSVVPDVPDFDWRADRFSLFQSILKPEGPQYRRLETMNLKGSATGTRGDYVR